MKNNAKEKKFISLVIYLHNSAERIVSFLQKAVPFFEENFAEYEMICVDDGCEDGTVEQLKAWLEKEKVKAMVSVIHMSFFQGLESAMNAGRDLAIGDFVYEFDDILPDYDADVLYQVYEKVLEGYDIVAASSKGRLRFTSRLFYKVYNMTRKTKGRIGPETFRIISRRAINRIRSLGSYVPYRKAVYANCGLRTATVFYESLDRDIRVKNKIVPQERTSLAVDSFIYFTNALEKISAIISGVFLTVTVAMGIYIITDAFNSRRPVEGWLSTMSFMALGFFGVFALLTIVLKYLSVLLNLVFRHQRYLVSDIEKVVKR